ncbi:MAG: hypothetical protein ACK4WH_08765 [Phycisphaerales bacterium]
MACQVLGLCLPEIDRNRRGTGRYNQYRAPSKMLRALPIILGLIIHSLAGLSYMPCRQGCCTAEPTAACCCGAADSGSDRPDCGGGQPSPTGSPCCGSSGTNEDDRSSTRCSRTAPAPCCAQTGFAWPGLLPGGGCPRGQCPPGSCPPGCCLVGLQMPLLRILESGQGLIKLTEASSTPIADAPSLAGVDFAEPQPPAHPTRSGLPPSSSRLRRSMLCVLTI